MTVGADTYRGITAERLRSGVPLYIIDDEKVVPAVVVGIKKNSTHSPAMMWNVSPVRNILERAVAAIAVKKVTVNTGDE